MPQLQKTRLGKRDLDSEPRTSAKMGTVAKVSRGGRPTKSEAEELGSRILDVSAELFATQGFAATSMEQIAASCSAGKDTIYRRYPSKSAIFSAIMARLHQKLIPNLDQAMIMKQCPLENLRHYSRTLLSINLRPDLLALNRVALGEAIAFGGVKPIPVHEDPIMQRFAVLVENTQRAGFLVCGNAHFIAEMLLYMTSVKPMISSMIGEIHFSDTCAQDEYFGKAWDMFLAGVMPRP